MKEKLVELGKEASKNLTTHLPFLLPSQYKAIDESLSKVLIELDTTVNLLANNLTSSSLPESQRKQLEDFISRFQSDIKPLLEKYFSSQELTSKEIDQILNAIHQLEFPKEIEVKVSSDSIQELANILSSSVPEEVKKEVYQNIQTYLKEVSLQQNFPEELKEQLDTLVNLTYDEYKDSKYFQRKLFDTLHLLKDKNLDTIQDSLQNLSSKLLVAGSSTELQSRLQQEKFGKSLQEWFQKIGTSLSAHSYGTYLKDFATQIAWKIDPRLGAAVDILSNLGLGLGSLRYLGKLKNIGKLRGLFSAGRLLAGGLTSGGIVPESLAGTVPLLTKGVSLLSKAAPVLGKVALPLAGAYAVYKGIKGWQSANEIFNTKYATLGRKLSAFTGSALSSLTLGILPRDFLAKGIYKIGSFEVNLLKDTYAIPKKIFGTIFDIQKNAVSFLGKELRKAFHIPDNLSVSHLLKDLLKHINLKIIFPFIGLADQVEKIINWVLDKFHLPKIPPLETLIKKALKVILPDSVYKFVFGSDEEKETTKTPKVQPTKPQVSFSPYNIDMSTESTLSPFPPKTEIYKKSDTAKYSQGLSVPDSVINETYKISPKSPTFQRILQKQIQVESSNNPNAVSKAGAVGLAQFKPSTWNDIWVNRRDLFEKYNPEMKKFQEVPDITNPEAQKIAQKAYMSYLLDKFNGDVRWALSAYNAGEGRVAKLYRETNGDFLKAYSFLPKETKSYVAKIVPPSLPKAPEPIAQANKEQVSQQPIQTQPQTVQNINISTSDNDWHPKDDYFLISRFLFRV